MTINELREKRKLILPEAVQILKLKSAQSKIKKISGKAVNGYVKGLTFTCYEVKPDGKYVWGRTPSGWVALDYCERV